MLDKYDVFYDEVNGTYQIRSRSDIFVIEFEEPEKRKLFERIVSIIQKDKEITLQEIINKCKGEEDKVKVLAMLKELKEVELLPYSVQHGLAQKGEATNPRQGNFNCAERKIGIIGNSELSKQLAIQANRHGYENCEIDPFMPDANPEKIADFLTDKDFLLVDHAKWNPYLIDQINKICIELDKPWMHIQGINGINANIGPIFWGKEFGCYNCLATRLKSHDDYQNYNSTYENHLYQSRGEAVIDSLTGSDVILSIIAGIAIVEMGKFLEEWDVPEVLGAYLGMNLLDYSIETHHLLKSPFCESCKPELSYNLSPWLEEVTLT